MNSKDYKKVGFAIILCLISFGVINSQLLDFDNKYNLVLEDYSTVVVFGDIQDENIYYYLPFSIELSRKNDGTPEFLFLKYTSDEDQEINGALFHMVIESRVNPEMLATLQEILIKKQPNAILKGPASPENGKIQIVSATLQGKKETIFTKKISAFSGGKHAFATKLDKTHSQLISNNLEKSIQDVSIVWSYSANFARRNSEGIVNTFNREFNILENLVQWYDSVRSNPKCVSSINLNDPFFQHKNVKFIVDLESVDLFENVVNYVTIQVRKKRNSDNNFEDNIIITRQDIEKKGLIHSVEYANGDDVNASVYEYKIQWSFRSGILFPLNPKWEKTDLPAISITAPIKKLNLEVETDYSQLRINDLVRVSFEIEYTLGESTSKNTYWRWSSYKDIPQLSRVFYNKNTDLKFRCTWYHKKKGSFTEKWKELNEEYVFLNIPDEFETQETNVYRVENDNQISPNNQLEKEHKSLKEINSYGLFFAVNSYEDSENYSSLANPIKNVNEIALDLSRNYNFTSEVIENPTRANIKNKLEEYHNKFLRGELDSDGQLIIFFSGHGEFEELSQNGFFLCHDSKAQDLAGTSIQYSYWRPRIDNIPCKHILVVIDACYSGTFDNEIAMRSGSRFKRPNELSDEEQYFYDFNSRTTRLYLVSGGKEKTPDKSQFAKKIQEGLRTFSNSGELISIGKLYNDFVRKSRPLPLLGEFGKDEAGSNFLFIRD